MWLQSIIGVAGLVLLALLYAALQELARRRRALGGDCRMDSIRCLGCLASRRCRALQRGTPRTTARGPPTTLARRHGTAGHAEPVIRSRREGAAIVLPLGTNEKPAWTRSA